MVFGCNTWWSQWFHMIDTWILRSLLMSCWFSFTNFIFSSWLFEFWQNVFLILLVVRAPPFVLYELILGNTFLDIFLSLGEYVIFSEVFLCQPKTLICRWKLGLSHFIIFRALIIISLDGPQAVSEFDDLIFEFRYLFQSIWCRH